MDGGSWNCEATAPDSRRNSVSPVSGFHGARLVAGQLLHARGRLADPVEAEAGLDAVERAQRDGDLAEVGVPGALAHPVDRAVDPRRARPHGGDRGGGGEPEVVVAVEVDGHPVDVLQGRADEVRDGLGRGDPERVDDGDLLRTRLDRGLVDLAVEVGLGAGRVDAEEGGADAVLVGEAHRARDALEHRRRGRRRSPRASGRRSATRSPRPRRRARPGARGPPGTAREKPQTSAFSPAPAISSTARRSSSDTRGKPASIRRIPSPSSSRAISSFSSGERTTPTVCSPSRSVVSYRPTSPRIA